MIKLLFKALHGLPKDYTKDGIRLAKYFAKDPKQTLFSFFSWINPAYYKGSVPGVTYGIKNSIKQARDVAKWTGQSTKNVMDDIFKRKTMLSYEHAGKKVPQIWKKVEKLDYNKNVDKFKQANKTMRALRKEQTDLIKASEPYARALNINNTYSKQASKYYDVFENIPARNVGMSPDLLKLNKFTPDRPITQLKIKDKEWLKELRAKTVNSPRFKEAYFDLAGDSNAFGKIKGGYGVKQVGPQQVQFTPHFNETRPWKPTVGQEVANKGDKVLGGFASQVDFTWHRPQYSFFDKTDFTGGLLGRTLDKFLKPVVITGHTL